MDLPKEYIQNLQKGIITYKMLDSSLYAVNKRAKNWRDIKRARKKDIYAYADLLGFELPETAKDAELMEKEMYSKKMELLTIIPPACIHKEFTGYSKQYVYDTDGQYDSLYLNALFHNGIVDKGTVHLDDGIHQYFLMETNPRYRYYLVRFMGDHAFHTPIKAEEVSKYDLPVYPTSKIKTEGEEEKLLAPMEFVENVLQLVRSGNYTYVDSGRTQIIREPFPIEPRKYEILQPYEWKEVLSILRRHYPQEPCLMKKIKLTPRLWKIIVSQEITVDSCMKIIRKEQLSHTQHIVMGFPKGKKNSSKNINPKEKIHPHK